MTGYIYALHLEGGPFRYVGMTSQPPHVRLRQHCQHIPRIAHLPVKKWAAEVGPANIRLTILEHVEEGTDVGSRERHWIAELQRQGIVLLNRTMGGQRGAVGYKHSDEERAARSARMKGKTYAAGAYRSPEYRERMSEIHKGKTCPEGCVCGRHSPSPERGARISAAKQAAKTRRQQASTD